MLLANMVNSFMHSLVTSKPIPILNGDNNLRKLTKLTEDLVPLLDLVMKKHDNVVEYNTMNDGVCFGVNLYNDGNIGIQKAFQKRGTQLPPHCHPGCTEWLIIISGALLIQFSSGIELIINTDPYSNVIAFQEQDVHQATAIEDTWMIAITIPAGEGYPTDGRSRG
jgi:quercetin dioxygenase-like cupin family protein